MFDLIATVFVTDSETRALCAAATAALRDAASASSLTRFCDRQTGRRDSNVKSTTRARAGERARGSTRARGGGRDVGERNRNEDSRARGRDAVVRATLERASRGGQRRNAGGKSHLGDGRARIFRERARAEALRDRRRRRPARVRVHGDFDYVRDRRGSGGRHGRGGVCGVGGACSRKCNAVTRPARVTRVIESARAKMPGGMAHCAGAVGDRRGAAISRRAESVARANST